MALTCRSFVCPGCLLSVSACSLTIQGSHVTVDISGKDIDEVLNEKALGKRLHSSTAAHKSDRHTDNQPQQLQQQQQQRAVTVLIGRTNQRQCCSHFIALVCVCVCVCVYASARPSHYNFGGSKDWSYEECEGQEDSDSDFED